LFFQRRGFVLDRIRNKYTWKKKQN
jgi:hypothetical protein